MDYKTSENFASVIVGLGLTFAALGRASEPEVGDRERCELLLSAENELEFVAVKLRALVGRFAGSLN